RGRRRRALPPEDRGRVPDRARRVCPRQGAVRDRVRGGQPARLAADPRDRHRRARGRRGLAMTDRALLALARSLGVQPSFTDVMKRRRSATTPTLLAVVSALL